MVTGFARGETLGSLGHRANLESILLGNYEPSIRFTGPLILRRCFFELSPEDQSELWNRPPQARLPMQCYGASFGEDEGGLPGLQAVQPGAGQQRLLPDLNNPIRNQIQRNMIPAWLLM
jgi:hypothetical protein